MRDRRAKDAISLFWLVGMVLALLAYAAIFILRATGIEVPTIPWLTAIRGAIAVILMLSLRRRRDPRPASPRSGAVGAVALAALCGTLLQITAASAAAIIVGSDVIGVGTAPKDAASWMTLASAVIVTPVFEELVFRGELFSLAWERAPAAAVICSSVAFALIHTGAATMAAAFVCGLILAALVGRRGRLPPAIALHAAFNLTSFFTGYLPFSPAAALTVCAPIAALGIFPLLKGKKNEALQLADAHRR